MKLALVVTAHCNASCTHCSTNNGPRRTEALSIADICRLMDEAAAIDDGEALRFDITGGEAFVDFEKLVTMVAYGASLGGVVSCTTNAYWAFSREAALAKLNRLKDNGLQLLSVSTSRFHQQFVPLKRVQIALAVAKELGMKPELKGNIVNSDLEPGGARDQWRDQLDVYIANIFPVLPHLREGASLPESEYYRWPGLPDQTCPSAGLCVEADGTASICCAPAIPKPFLWLGSVHEMPLADLNRRFRRLAKPRILQESGPIVFARAAIDAGLGSHLKDAYAGACDLCLHIASDPELARVANEVAAADDIARLYQAFGTSPDADSISPGAFVSPPF